MFSASAISKSAGKSFPFFTPVKLAGNLISSSFFIETKAFSPTIFNPSGKFKFFKLLAFSKARSPISVILFPLKTNLFIAVVLAKALFPIYVQFWGTSNSCIDTQPLNAFSFILFNLLLESILTFFNFLQF